VVFVKHDGFLADLENVRHFLHRTAFGQQLKHFLLAGGKLFGELSGAGFSNELVF
jgi:hypothetical protein